MLPQNLLLHVLPPRYLMAANCGESLPSNPPRASTDARALSHLGNAHDVHRCGQEYNSSYGDPLFSIRRLYPNQALAFSLGVHTGIAESSTFVGTQSVALIGQAVSILWLTWCFISYLLGCWYRENELGKRGAIFSISAQIATIFSGVLQASIYKNLNGHAGLAGYQWLFIICASERHRCLRCLN